MKEINITEENKDIYQKFYDIKVGDSSFNTKCEAIPALLFGISLIIMYRISALSSDVLLTIFNNYDINSFGLNVIGGLLFSAGFFTSLNLNIKLSNKMSLNAFKKHYPDFDTDIDINKVKEKLTEYRLNQIPIYSMSNSSEINEEEKHLNFYTNNFKEMSNEEKLAFLESEKEFWSKYQENYNIEENIQKKKEF